MDKKCNTLGFTDQESSLLQRLENSRRLQGGVLEAIHANLFGMKIHHAALVDWYTRDDYTGITPEYKKGLSEFQAIQFNVLSALGNGWSTEQNRCKAQELTLLYDVTRPGAERIQQYYTPIRKTYGAFYQSFSTVADGYNKWAHLIPQFHSNDSFKLHIDINNILCSVYNYDVSNAPEESMQEFLKTIDRLSDISRSLILCCTHDAQDGRTVLERMDDIVSENIGGINDIQHALAVLISSIPQNIDGQDENILNESDGVYTNDLMRWLSENKLVRLLEKNGYCNPPTVVALMTASMISIVLLLYYPVHTILKSGSLLRKI
jgi:hypothetical protein